MTRYRARLRSWRARERVSFIQMYVLGSASIFRIVFELFFPKYRDTILSFAFFSYMECIKPNKEIHNLMESFRLLSVLLFEQQHQECYTSYSTLKYSSYCSYSKYSSYSLSYFSCSSYPQLFLAILIILILSYSALLSAALAALSTQLLWLQ